MIDYKKPEKVYFIGIGGISMSGLALLLKDKGFDVSGSDRSESAVTRHLEDSGIKVFYGQKAENIANDIDLVVYTAAIKEDNPELVRARELKCRVIERAELVGELMKLYERSYAVAGTHGKTTTTSMLALICIRAGLDPTVSVGGILGAIGGNMRIGGNENFVVEACEYTNSFLKFHPTRAGILNIEAEHLDFFKDIDDIRASFRKFAELVPEGGVLAINGKIENLAKLTDGLQCKVITFGVAEGETADTEAGATDGKGAAAGAGIGSAAAAYDYTAGNISYNADGFASYDLIERGTVLGRISLSVPGIHSVLDSLCAVALARFDVIEFDVIAEALSSYTGTKRRFEDKGVVGGVRIIDDYAHHPSEIKATLTAALRVPHKTLWCVFQPHTYSRTKLLLEDFAKELSHADRIVLAPIYAAREADPGDISSEDIAKILESKYGKDVNCFSSFDEIEDFLLENCVSGDVLITMGAGDVVKIGEDLLGV